MEGRGYIVLRSFILDNRQGGSIDFVNNTNFDLLAVTGLNPVTAEIGTTIIAGVDGANETTSRLGVRNITVLLNIRQPIENNRNLLYSYFSTNRNVRIKIKTDSNDVFIDGRIESFENDNFTQLQQPLISILCPEPHFQSSEEIIADFTQRENLLEFPLEVTSQKIELSTLRSLTKLIVDAGQIETGFNLEFKAVNGDVEYPLITNLTTQDVMSVNCDLSEGNIINLSTIKGQKKAILNISNGAGYTNIIGNVSYFMQLQRDTMN